MAASSTSRAARLAVAAVGRAVAAVGRAVAAVGRAVAAVGRAGRSRAFTLETAYALAEIKPGEVGIVSGISKEHLRRRVLIYSPARTATQQGSGKVGRWKINFVSTQKWENPLMGWTSTGDPYANVGDSALSFDSVEAAKAFAEKHGWEYSVKKRHTPLLKAKAYADNFKWKGPPTTDV